MSKDDPEGVRLRWARLRFSIIGSLLASPPDQGKLVEQFRKLAQKTVVSRRTTGKGMARW